MNSVLPQTVLPPAQAGVGGTTAPGLIGVGGATGAASTAPGLMGVGASQVADPASIGTSQVADLGTELRLALTRITRQLRAQRGTADLPEGQFAILTTLAKHGPMTPGALATHERVRPPSMTRAINLLAELGLVNKSEHASDKRQVMVTLTPAGAHEVDETRRRRDVWLTLQLAELTPQERQTLNTACELMNRMAAR